MKNKITILHTESSTGWGGQEIRILQEAIGIRKRGYRVIIGAEKNSNLLKKALDNNLEVFPINFSKYALNSYLILKKIIERERVDIVNTHSSKDSWVATLAAKMTNRKPKIIRTRHLSTPISKSFTSRLIYNILPDVILTTGEKIKSEMININKFDPNKIFSVPTGIDIEKFKREETKPSLKRSKFTVGTVSILRSWKGHEYLIRAIPIVIEKVTDIHFYIVGDGPQYDNLKRLIQELRVEMFVTMTGYRDNIPEILASFDILVHPSYANEGVPQTILQALAMNIPVIACNAGSIGEVIINGETGILIEPKKHNKIADTILNLLNNDKMREKLAKSGRKLVEKEYSLDKMLDKIEDIYDRILSLNKSEQEIKN